MFLNSGLDGLITLLVIIGVVSVIAIVSYLVYRFTHPKLKGEEKDNKEEENLAQEMDRILSPVEDEETARAIENYKEEDEE
jgi:hypothetical protein